MTRLEDLQPNAAVRGTLPDALVTVVSEDGDRFEDRFRDGVHTADASLTVGEAGETPASA